VQFVRFVETVSPDRVIRGSDEPFDTADDDPLDTSGKAGSADRKAALHGN